MKSSAKNIVLKSVDDIFQTEENRADAQREWVQEIPLDQLKPFRNHPFSIETRWDSVVHSFRDISNFSIRYGSLGGLLAFYGFIYKKVDGICFW